MKHLKLTVIGLFFILTATAQAVKVSVSKVKIPTYEEPEKEQLPMFAENRVHQRSTGNPYPNKVVLKVNRKQKVDKEYTLITLENEYLEIQLLPALGGKIFAAKDKVNGYNFFYNQHVIKPALIGALGSWTSGGLEFNWPYHHRASAFMPVDYKVEKLDNGGVIVWMSEHEPTDRMRGMVGIVLNPGESIFETRVRLSNITPFRHSFLWWENAAVPSNEQYHIFFPHDVSHVFFHYKKSVTTYPIATSATGVYNGIKFDKAVDISQHKNTRQPTSYFSAASEYDFFGGYDEGKKAGVVHVGDHHISPGKKMFTWAYNQLSRSWENALTDTDGAYCELMAGSYSDNQPDFSWLEPMETKTFSQYWFPIGALGVPDFANTSGAIYCKDTIKFQLNKSADVKIRIKDSTGHSLLEKDIAMQARKVYVLPEQVKLNTGYSIEILDKKGSSLMNYTLKHYDRFNVPHIREERPNQQNVLSPYQLYLEGVHVDQYRDPATKGVAYYEEAIKRDPDFVPALIGLGESKLRQFFTDEALQYLSHAEKVLTQFNKHPESGKLYYLLGQAYVAKGDLKTAYDYFQKSAWNEGAVSAAMTFIGMLDVRAKQYDKALLHLSKATAHNKNNDIANALLIYVYHLKGDKAASAAQFQMVENEDKLNHLARYFGVLTGQITGTDFLDAINTDKNQVGLDLAETLLLADLKDELLTLGDLIKQKQPLCYSFLAILSEIKGTEPDMNATEGIAFPSRLIELNALSNFADQGNKKAKFQLACALYDMGHYKKAASYWEEIKADNYRAARNLAVAYYTHLDRRDEVLGMLEKALSLNPNDEQLIFEHVYVMGKLGVPAEKRIDFLQAHKSAITRDDILLEWARAYNMAGREDDAIDLLLGHEFIPTEGGEHAVADQYMTAFILKGRKLMHQNSWKEAADCFKSAQTLPQNLGAGLWNKVKLVPAKYYEAICLKKLGDTKKADENFKFITDIEIDYFSNMSQPDLPYYQALCYKQMELPIKGDILINYKLQEWKKGLKTVDPGYFSTTPFFISYVDAPREQRAAYFNYLLALAYKYIGDQDLFKLHIEEASKNDPYALNIFELKHFAE